MAKLSQFNITSGVSARTKVFYKLVLTTYLLVLLWLVLFKFSLDLSVAEYPARTLNLIPFTDAKDNLSEIILNLIAFVPLGLLLSIGFKQTELWRKLALIFILSLTVETAQFIFVIGIADIN